MLNSDMTCLNNINAHKLSYEPLRNVHGGKLCSISCVCY